MAEADNLRVLIVDDNRTNLKMLHAMLKRGGHEVSEAANGKIACDLVEKQIFDVVFMDLSMPVMSGFEATTYIRKNLSLSMAELPIIAVSAHTDEETRLYCSEIGINAFVAKPITRINIIGALELLVNGSSSKENAVALFS